MTEALNIDEGTLKLKKLVLQRRAETGWLCLTPLMQVLARPLARLATHGVVLDATQTVVAQAQREDARSQRHATQRATHHLRTSARLLCDHRASRQRRIVLSAQPLHGELR